MSAESEGQFKWFHKDPRTAYRFTETRLGVGHFGTTFLATHVHTKEMVACKAIAKSRPDVKVTDVQNECRIMWYLKDHPNIITLKEVWEDHTHIYIFMEACFGGELFDYIVKKKQFKEKEAAKIARVVLEVIKFLHSKGVMHRDLKPENFLLKTKQEDISDRDLRCIDFGLSSFVPTPHHVFNHMVGSSYYVAPEVLKKQYTMAADLWSAGVIIYILLSGYPPFWGNSDAEVFQRVLFGDVDLKSRGWATVSDTAKGLVQSLLTRDPAKRANAAAALQHPWITEGVKSEAILSPEIMSRLTEFTTLTNLRKLLLNAVAKHMSSHDLDNLAGIFRSIDADSSGAISAVELKEALDKNGYTLPQEAMDSLLRAIDMGQSGNIDYEEFLAAAIDRRRVLNVDTLVSIFRSMDHDNDGFISVTELLQALQAVNIKMDFQQLREMVKQELPEAKDEDPSITLNQFIILLQDRGEGDRKMVNVLDEIVANWNHFTSMNGFKQLARLVIARYIEPTDLADVRVLFERLDLDKSGKLRFAEIRQALREAGYFVADDQLARIYGCLDVKHTGDIDYEEFLAGALADQTYLSESTLRTVFEYFDKNHDGQISTREIQEILAEFHLPEAAATELLRIADEDKNSMISYDEFKLIMGYSGDKGVAMDTGEKTPLQLNFTKAKGEQLKQLLQDMDRMWMGYVPDSTSTTSGQH